MKNKILSFLLAFCLIIPCTLTLVACKDKSPKMETWDGTTQEVSAEVNNVITIDTAEELAGFAKSVNSGNTYTGKTIKLACDMDMRNKAWTPIGVGNRKAMAEAKVFAGTFDGNGKKIINLSSEGYIPSNANKTQESDLGANGYTYSYGFFGITQNAIIKNLTLEVDFDCDEDNLKGDSVGGIVGFAKGGLTIENCVVNGEIDGGYDAVGGIVGRAYDSTSENSVEIKNCVNNAEIEAMFKAAGILGYANSGTLYLKIDNCINNAEVEVDGIETGGVFFSAVAGILNYGWGASSSTNTLIVTNNINNGILKSVEEESQTLTNYHGYAYIARNTGNAFKDDLHSFDFRGNVNYGKVYYKEVEATDARGVLVQQSYSPYLPAQDYNGQTDFGQ